MPEHILQGDKQEIIDGLANVVAGLNLGRAVYEKSYIKQQLDSGSIYESQPVSPGPKIMLKPLEDGTYKLKINGKGENHTGNVTKANELVDTYLAEYFVAQQIE